MLKQATGTTEKVSLPLTLGKADGTVTRTALGKLIKTEGHKFFSVLFTKKNGDLRKLNGRCKVHKHTKGGERTTAHLSDYVCMWEQGPGLPHGQYRNVAISRVLQFKMKGKVYNVID